MEEASGEEKNQLEIKKCKNNEQLSHKRKDDKMLVGIYRKLVLKSRSNTLKQSGEESYTET